VARRRAAPRARSRWTRCGGQALFLADIRHRQLAHRHHRSADDLNRNAANAILKILEEPPKRAMFLVLSHAPGRLLPTIRSRCLPLKLDALSEDAMRRALGQLGLSIGEAQAGAVFRFPREAWRRR